MKTGLMEADLMRAAGRMEDDHPGQDFKALKAKYLAGFASQASHVGTWRQIVCALTEDFGISRRTLKNWAVAAGYDGKYVSTVLSKTLVSIGHREREKGGGRKASPEVEEMLAIAKGRYGKKYLTVLAATLKTGRAREEAEKFSEEQRVSLSLLVGTNKKSERLLDEAAWCNALILTTGGGQATFAQGSP